MKIRSIRRILTAIALVAVIGAGPQPAGAQDKSSDTEQSRFIQRFDQDGDGLVSEAEFPGQDDQFSQFDSDGDGYIDASEVPQRPPHGGPGGSDFLAQFDTDGDGQLSADEFPGPVEHFADLDTDSDGFLTAQELLAGRPGPPANGGFESDDGNHDGRVSQAEFSGPADLFSRLDTDGDGYISRDEVQNSRHRHGGPGRAPQTDTEQE